MYKIFLLLCLLPVICCNESTNTQFNIYNDFNKRVESFINATLQINSCDMYVNLLKLEYSQEFCGDDFISEVIMYRQHFKNLDCISRGPLKL